jgi:DNA-binding CsgD family transcriptional regulator/tetratricopeptide (TPR) repeat protein
LENSAVGGSATSAELLERSQHLMALRGSLVAVLGSQRGRLVLVRGETGVGKSAVVRRFCDELSSPTRVLWGACDALFTPRALGPFVDIARVTGGELEALVERGAQPYEVLSAFTAMVARRSPTVVVLEDLHWADEGTLDALRLLGRRVDAVPCLVVATYRDDELDGAHPLRVVLGELARGRGIDRLDLAPLSPVAVAELAEPYGVDAEALYRTTGGNPFFVTEVLAAGMKQIPSTVRDAVLARAARLSGSARALLEALTVGSPAVEVGLLQAIAPDVVECLDECLGSGMVIASAGGLAFRHELARLVIEESLAPHRRTALHRQALRELVDSPTAASDPARLAHHADAAGDAGAVLRFGPEAARRASALGAHRESAAQYARALRFAGKLPPEQRAALLERRAYECMVTDQTDGSIEAASRAITLWHDLGDVRREAVGLDLLSQVLWCPGRVAESAEAAREAVAVLEGLEPGRELAMAYERLSQVCKDTDDINGAVAWGTQALELARALGETKIAAEALIDIGAAMFMDGAPEGREKLDEALVLAREARLDEPVARGMTNFVRGAMRQRSYELARQIVEPGLEFVSDRGLELWRLYLLGYRAQIELGMGRWAEAVDTAGLVLREPRRSIVPRIFAHAVIGRVRARRSDPEAWPQLDEALSLAKRSDELQSIEPVAEARTEAAWLEGNRDGVDRESAAALGLARQRRASWVVGELAVWRRRAALTDQTRDGEMAEPYALDVAGDWSGAAARWRELGFPYEAALALVHADDEDALRQALEQLQALGARSAAAIVARRLRGRGARGLPRGPRPQTRANPAGLTAREAEVLVLLADGLANAEIAQRLVVSEKTASHHVSAILRKLGVRTRGAAAARGARLGLTAPR